MAYDYMKALVDDIKAYIEENYDVNDYEDREEFEETLNDDLWAEDDITGNGSGSYTMDRAKAKEYINGDPNADDYIDSAIADFGIEAKEVAKHRSDWEYWDVTIRCYLLGQAISQALDELGIQ